LKSIFSSNFVFAVCQVGAVDALKKELAREHPSLKFAYSRPGFITFKESAPKLDHEGNVRPLAGDFPLRSVFARAYGVSLVEVKPTEISKVIDCAKELQETHARGERKIRLHVWERDLYSPGEEPLGFIHGVQAKKLEAEVRAAGPEFFAESPVATVGDLVLDLIVLEEGKYWLGMHQHTVHHSAWPGGRPAIPLLAEAPSRAYLKLEEALLWSRADLKSGDTAVEIGSAPGGASYALLRRGITVAGIDPAEMDPRVLNHPRFRHFRQPVNSVLREDLPESVEWLLLDMNDSLLGVFLTIKLNQWKIADEIPEIIAHVKSMGMVRVKATQLAFNRQEICVFGLTQKGVARKDKARKL
jgi:23S rRNA (cytidine2498-2'-O)-methyltransferase